MSRSSSSQARKSRRRRFGWVFVREGEAAVVRGHKDVGAHVAEGLERFLGVHMDVPQ